MRNAEIVETVDGRFMILVNGFQWGGEYDASGAGNLTFDTRKQAAETIRRQRMYDADDRRIDAENAEWHGTYGTES